MVTWSAEVSPSFSATADLSAITVPPDVGIMLGEKPGGRFAVSDVVTKGEMLPEIRKSVLLWVGCVAGALEENEYRSKLAAAGFENIDVEPTRIYRVEDAREFLSAEGIDVDAIAPQVDGKFMGAFIRAVKPKSCCGPTCCA